MSSVFRCIEDVIYSFLAIPFTYRDSIFTLYFHFLMAKHIYFIPLKMAAVAAAAAAAAAAISRKSFYLGEVNQVPLLNVLRSL